MKGLSRRALMEAALAAAGLTLARAVPRITPHAQSGSGHLHLPLVIGRPRPSPTPSPTAEPVPSPEPVPGNGRVVHVHGAATYWDYGSNYYGDYVDQDAVDAMMDAGVVALTGKGTAAEAWRSIVPDYVPGRAVAIKLNMNNNYYCDLPRVGCEEWQLTLDGIIHPVNAIVRGLRGAYPTFDDADIWVYDATMGDNPPVSWRRIPTRVIAGCRYPGVRFFDTGCVERATYDGTSPSALVAWHPPSGIPAPPTMQVTDLLVKTSYVINLPIMRSHGAAGVTLGFKNHLGSVANCAPLHAWICRDGPYLAATTYSPLVDLYLNPNIGGKTVLVVGDGLYGNWENNTTKAKPWRTFGGRAPNSLFLSTDPVAIDCVMTDLMDAENPVLSMADGYQQVAARAGLGVYERGDPWGAGYARIQYLRLEV